MNQSLVYRSARAAFVVLMFAGELLAFPIANQGAAVSAASDGTRYLAGIENHLTATPSIACQLLVSDGSKLGGLVSTNRTGTAADVSFNGESYLLTWEDDGLGTLSGNTGWQMYGQFVTRGGELDGGAFPISGIGIWADGMKMNVYGGGVHLVVYTKLIDPALGDHSTNRKIAGRIVSPYGAVSAELPISSGYGSNPTIGFDGTNFLVAWHEDEFDTEVRARLVSPSGALGTELSVNASPAPSDNPISIGFDGSNFIVTWSDETGGQYTQTWDACAQRVSPAGALVGGVITIANSPYPEIATTIAFDGVNHLACWIQMASETESTIMGRFFNPSGTPVGEAFPIDTRVGTEIGGAIYASGKFLALIVDGEMGGGGFSSVTATDGAWISPAGIRPIDAWRTLKFGSDASIPAIAGDLADPDHDGVRNIEEYAFGTNPKAAQGGPAFAFSLVAGKPHLQFNRPSPADVTYVVQSSDDLGAWQDVAILPENSFTWTGPAGIIESGSGNTRSVTVFDPSPGPSAPRQFVRVMVLDTP